MDEYIKREDALKIIDNYSTAVTEDGKVVADAIRDIIAVITPTADVVPKSEVEKLKADVEVWKQNRFNIYQKLECYKMTRAKVAREIFEEIEKHLIFNAYGIATISDKTFAELKKKYTEDKG